MHKSWDWLIQISNIQDVYKKDHFFPPWRCALEYSLLTNRKKGLALFHLICRTVSVSFVTLSQSSHCRKQTTTEGKKDGTLIYGQFIDWLTCRLTHWLTSRPNNWLIYKLTKVMKGRLADWQTDLYLTDIQIDGVEWMTTNWLKVDWLTYYLTKSLSDWLIDYLTLTKFIHV